MVVGRGVGVLERLRASRTDLKMISVGVGSARLSVSQSTTLGLPLEVGVGMLSPVRGIKMRCR